MSAVNTISVGMEISEKQCPNIYGKFASSDWNLSQLEHGSLGFTGFDSLISFIPHFTRRRKSRWNETVERGRSRLGDLKR